jgi:predicted metal-dependent phosphoesterase TrpH
VTDHNTILGARETQALDPELIIIGEEIMTTHGEILAAFVQEEVPPGLLPQETIGLLKEQGAFISVSHPFDRWRSGGWKVDQLIDMVPELDAIEIFNAHCFSDTPNRLATEFSQEHSQVKSCG